MSDWSEDEILSGLDTVKALLLKHHVFGSHNIDGMKASVERIIAKRNQARADTIEECAKVADMEFGKVAFDDHQVGYNECAGYIAGAIRALKTSDSREDPK